MNRLFFRVYVSFCIALAAAALAFVFVSTAARRDTLQSTWGTISGGALTVVAETAAAERRTGGDAAAESYVAGAARATHLGLFLFDRTGGLIGTGVAPAEVRDLAKQAFAAKADASRQILVPLRLMGAFTVYEAGKVDNTTVLVAQVRGGIPRNLITPAIRLVSALVVIALVCYFLTRSITDPILALRRAATRMADGDLSTRVASVRPLAGRRDEIGALGRDFDRMAERLEAARLAQGRLLADVSHELRSPLTRLGLSLALARRRFVGTPDSKEAYLARIERETARMNTLIEQLLTIARLDSDDGREMVNMPRVDIEPTVRAVVDDADYEAAARDKHCIAEIDAIPPIRADVELLRRAVENVVRNAIYYTDEGTTVKVAAHTDGGFVRITVSDKGPGVPDSAVADLFRPFYRVADARERATGGTGLGLAIADRAARAHGGTITAQNSLTGGLIVTITLPLASDSTSRKRS